MEKKFLQRGNPSEIITNSFTSVHSNTYQIYHELIINIIQTFKNKWKIKPSQFPR